MVSFSASINRTKANLTSNVVNTNKQYCTSTNTTEANNNVQVINGNIFDSTVTEGVNANVDATCMIVSDMETSAINDATLQLDQTNEYSSGLFGSLGINYGVNLSSTVVNSTTNVYQSNQALCNSAVITSANNNVQIVNGNVTSSSVSLGITDSNTSSSCTLGNYMKTKTFNGVQSKVDQENEAGSSPLQKIMAAIGGLIILIVVIIVIVIGLIIIIPLIGALIKSTKPKNNPVPVTSTSSNTPSSGSKPTTTTSSNLLSSSAKPNTSTSSNLSSSSNKATTTTSSNLSSSSTKPAKTNLSNPPINKSNPSTNGVVKI